MDDSRVALDTPGVPDSRSDRRLARVVMVLEGVERCAHAHVRIGARVEHAGDLVELVLVVVADSSPIRDDVLSCLREPRPAMQEDSWCEQRTVDVDRWLCEGVREVTFHADICWRSTWSLWVKAVSRTLQMRLCILRSRGFAERRPG